MSEKQATQLNAFEELYKKKLTSDEIEEMKSNFFGFMELLIEIDQEQKASQND